MEATPGNSIFDFETLFSDFQEWLNGSGLRTGFAVESGHERTFSFENLLSQPCLFSKEACKTSQKLSEKGCFRLEILVFFYFFLSSWLIFSHKSNVTPHFWPWKKTTWPKGWRCRSNIWHMEKLCQHSFFLCGTMWKISFFLSTLTVVMLSKRSSTWLNRIHDVDTHKYLQWDSPTEMI